MFIFTTEEERERGERESVQLNLGMSRRSFVAGCQVANIQVTTMNTTHENSIFFYLKLIPFVIFILQIFHIYVPLNHHVHVCDL